MEEKEDFNYEAWLEGGGEWDPRSAMSPDRPVKRFRRWFSRRTPWLQRLLKAWEKTWLELRIK